MCVCTCVAVIIVYVCVYMHACVCVCVCVCAATKSRLERELAEAVQEDSSNEGSRSTSPPLVDGYDPGSESDDDQPAHSSVAMGNQLNAMEMSLWSLDASATSSMETSMNTENEVKYLV